MSKSFGAVVVVGVLLLAPAMSVAAAEMKGGGSNLITLSLTPGKDTASPWTTEMGYSNRAIHKLGFGLKNLLLGWTDLFTEPKQALDAGNNFFVGVGYGIKDAIENELGGVVHVVTFPITNVDAPLPEGGVQLM